MMMIPAVGDALRRAFQRRPSRRRNTASWRGPASVSPTVGSPRSGMSRRRTPRAQPPVPREGTRCSGRSRTPFRGKAGGSSPSHHCLGTGSGYALAIGTLDMSMRRGLEPLAPSPVSATGWVGLRWRRQRGSDAIVIRPPSPLPEPPTEAAATHGHGGASGDGAG